MQKRTFIAAGTAFGAATVGMLGFTERAVAKNLTLEALSGADLASDANTLLVDIRQPQEWQDSGVIEGALLHSYTSPENFMKVVGPKLAKGQRLALICRSGNRTSHASKQIAGLVDGPIVDVQGGMIRVVREGYRPVKPTREMGCQIC